MRLWRRAYARRMPSSCAGAKSCSLVIGVRTLIKSPAPWDATPRRRATPSTLSTTGVYGRRLRKDPPDRTPSIGPSTPKEPSVCGRCSTEAPGTSGCAGSGPRGGSRVRTRSTKEKETSRPVDEFGGAQRGLGVGLRGRGLVEPPCFAHVTRLEHRRGADAPGAPIGRQRRPRSEGHLLLRALLARVGTDVAALRGWPSRKRHNDSISRLVLPEAQGDWQESMGVGLGQCQLAHKPRGTPMDRRAQPPSEAE